MEDSSTELVAAPFVPTALKRQQTSITAYDYLNDLDKTRAAYEDARVLYVAATRAERQLHLLGAAKPDKSGEAQARKNTFLHLLWPTVSEWFTSEHDIVSRYPSAQQEADIRQFVPKLIRLREASTPAILQASQHEANTGYQAEASDSKASRLEADIGTLAHLYLQLIAEQGLPAWHMHEQNAFSTLRLPMQRWFKQQGYAEHEATQGATQVATLLNTTLQSEDGRWVLHPHAQAASELAIEQLSERKKVIDRTFVADGVRWIVDYKSMPVSAQDDLTLLAAAFQPQLAAYAQLFQMQGLPIKTAILFLSAGKLTPVDIH